MELVIKPRRNKTPSIPGNECVRDLEKDIESFSEFTKDIAFPVYLTGGVAISIKLNDFYRHNVDIDLGIFTKDLEKFYDFLKSKNYGLVRRVFTTHISPKHTLDLVVVTNPKDILNKERRHLRILTNHRKNLLNVTNRTDYMDLFLYEKRDSEIFLLEENSTVPSSSFFPSSDHELNNGNHVKIPKLDYLMNLKSKWKRKIDVYDLDYLKNLKG